MQLVLSDIHANAPALEAVLDATSGRHDGVLMLGDVVGYGPHPNECCAMLRELPALRSVRGNHDKAAVGLSEPDHFHDAARTAIEWTSEQLEPQHAEWLRELPAGPVELDGRLVLSHGTPLDEEAYLLGAVAAHSVASRWPGAVVLFGHTHLPSALRVEGGRVDGGLAGRPHELRLDEATWLLNPGSVGQPRDGDVRAAYGLLDLEQGSFRFERAAYDVEAVQADMRSVDLPERLTRRLGEGA